MAQTRIIATMDPPVDVFMVQEITAAPDEMEGCSVLDKLCSALRDFELHSDPSWQSRQPYFVAIFTRRNLFANKPDVIVEDFAGSRMGRGLVTVEGSLASNGAKVAFVTSHFESEKDNSAQRKVQFERMVAQMRVRSEKGVTTIFGGDTNLREGEISAVTVAKKVESEAKERNASVARDDARRRVADAYIQAGADPKQKFTWDCEQNDNILNDWDFKPRSRYDRVFLFGPVLQFPICTGWKLVGTNRLPCSKFPSDHWGVRVDIEIRAEDELVGDDERGLGVIDVDEARSPEHRRGSVMSSKRLPGVRLKSSPGRSGKRRKV